MELKHIKELMTAMGRTGIKSLTIKKESFELVLVREDHVNGRDYETQYEFLDEAIKQNPNLSRTDQALSRGSEMPARTVASSISNEPIKESVPSSFVTSPMVGTFYIAPSPDDPPFIKVGDKIDKNTIVCIIEAMKVMNEIKANVTGIVAEMLVKTGQPVEFGSKLFRIIE